MVLFYCSYLSPNTLPKWLQFRLGCSLPDLYIPRSRINAGLASDGSSCITSEGTGGATGNENLLWYFREDRELMQEHWMWHQYFPTVAPKQWDRRGEHFYWMHHNFIARYQAERLAHNLPLESALDIRYGGNIGEGYDADLFDRTAQEAYTPRPANVLLQDINHLNGTDYSYEMTIERMIYGRDNLTTHISEGYLLAANDTQINVKIQEGIDIVGNTAESNQLTVNRQLYIRGGLHNNAHQVVGLSADPDYKLGLPAGVMVDPATAPRDPVFFKVHGLIDDVFNQHKITLRPYQLKGGEWPLRWEGVTINSLKVEGESGENNILETFWRIKETQLEQGINGRVHDGTVYPRICQKHLDHEEFTFELAVHLRSLQSVRGNVRLFMAPREDGTGRRFELEDERRLLFQLDVFPVDLRPGTNHITRRSSDSSSTRPWSRSLDEMLSNLDNSGKAERCSCGWPAHLYLPKGTKEGMKFDLVAMITNFEDDKVEDDPEDLKIPEPCNMPYIYCGIPYRKYPDKRPMGYPFDRLPFVENGQAAKTLEGYVDKIPNMVMTMVTVKHSDTIKDS